MSTLSSLRNGSRLALTASTNSGGTPIAAAISRHRSASKPSTSFVVGVLKPNAMTSNLVPQPSLPAALILPIVESAANLCAAAADGLDAPPVAPAPPPVVQAEM